MSIREALQQYINEEITAIELIRLLTGVFDPDNALELMALINQVCRHEEGDIPTVEFKKIYDLD